jgi:hypothetical protein
LLAKANKSGSVDIDVPKSAHPSGRIEAKEAEMTATTSNRSAAALPDYAPDWPSALLTDFKDFTELAPGAYQTHALETMLGQVIAWSQALALLRQVRQAA